MFVHKESNGCIGDDNIAIVLPCIIIISLKPLVLSGGRDTLTEREPRQIFCLAFVELKGKMGWWLNKLPPPIVYLINWWCCLGSLRTCGPVGGNMLLEVSLRV